MDKLKNRLYGGEQLEPNAVFVTQNQNYTTPFTSIFLYTH